MPHRTVARSDVLHLLREHLSRSIVRIGGRWYRQSRGIPQVRPWAHGSLLVRSDCRGCGLPCGTHAYTRLLLQ